VRNSRVHRAKGKAVKKKRGRCPRRQACGEEKESFH
jgi:hypothetical protein